MNKIAEIFFDEGNKYKKYSMSIFPNTKIKIIGIHKNGENKMEKVFEGTIENLLFNLWYRHKLSGVIATLTICCVQVSNIISSHTALKVYPRFSYEFSIIDVWCISLIKLRFGGISFLRLIVR